MPSGYMNLRCFTGEETVPCKWCGVPTPMTGTKCCDNCWEMASRIFAYPALAEKMLAAKKEGRDA